MPQDLMGSPMERLEMEKRVEGWPSDSPTFRSSTEGKEIEKEQLVRWDQNQKTLMLQEPR